MTSSLRLLAVGSMALPGSPSSPPAAASGWKLEQVPDLLRLIRQAEPVRYGGAGLHRPQLVVDCVPAGIEGPTATHFKAMFLPAGRAFARSLAGHHGLAVTYTLWKQPNTTTSTFSLDGFDQASTDLFAACPDGR